MINTEAIEDTTVEISALWAANVGNEDNSIFQSNEDIRHRKLSVSQTQEILRYESM